MFSRFLLCYIILAFHGNIDTDFIGTESGFNGYCKIPLSSIILWVYLEIQSPITFCLFKSERDAAHAENYILDKPFNHPYVRRSVLSNIRPTCAAPTLQEDE